MSEAVEYSKRLGRISDTQFAAAAKRLGVGTFIRAAPVTSGLFGQNVFLTTSEGEFVLRGAPHWVDLSQEGPWKFEQNDLWQFSKEVWFADQLHQHTDAPVPWPQLLDKESDIFGWPYIIMAKMPGTCFDDRKLAKEHPPARRQSAARALGTMLARLQRFTNPFPGGFDLSLKLAAYSGGHTQQVIRETKKFAANARSNGALDPKDDAWIEQIAATALTASEADRPNVYVHGDYKLGNTTLSEVNGVMSVTGVFDLHESRLGDGALDLCRQACSYMDFDPEMTREYVASYRSQVSEDPTLAARLPLYLVNDRMKLWEYVTRPNVRTDWLVGKTFREWTARYIDTFLALL